MTSSNTMNNLVYDCVVVGTGISAEPVLHHLSKTNLKVLVIDGSEIKNDYCERKESNKEITRLTPKQIFKSLNIYNNTIPIKSTRYSQISCSKFTYIYTSVSGGLSNFWGGGLHEWPDDELTKTTTLPLDKVKESYKDLKNRLICKSRDHFFNSSPFAMPYINDKKVSTRFITKVTEFFFNPHGLSTHPNRRLPFDQHLIWNSKSTILNYINTSKNLIYKSNITVESIRNTSNENTLYCTTPQGDVQIHSKNIFLCCGTINSTLLAFSALQKPHANLELRHTNAAICPVLSLKKSQLYSNNNIDLPDISWSYYPSKNQEPSAAGYLIASNFLLKRFKSRFYRILSPKITVLFTQFFSSLTFLTIYKKDTNSNTHLKITRKSSHNESHSDFLLEISSKPKIQKIMASMLLDMLSLGKWIKNRSILLIPLARLVRIGADVHYTSTMPDSSLKYSEISTNSYGEIQNLVNIYACDPSRLAYLSCLPHSFTSMAIINASMPHIIDKIQKNL